MPVTTLPEHLRTVRMLVETDIRPGSFGEPWRLALIGCLLLAEMYATCLMMCACTPTRAPI